MNREEKVINYLSSISLAEGEKVSNVEVLRVGTIFDRGLKIDSKMLEAYVKNHEENVYGTDIQVNLEHRRGSEAAGWVKNLFIEGRKLFAEIEWTELGIEKISKKLFKFVSAELAYSYPHHKNGEEIQNVFIGLALTNTPALKSQKPLALAEHLINNLHMFEKLLQNLKERKFVSKEDKALLNSMLSELPTEEQETQKAGVAEVEAKPEMPEKTEEEKAKELADAEKAKAEAQVLEDKAKQAVSLEEKLADESRKRIALEEKVMRTELGEKVEKELFVSKDRSVGIFGDKAKNAVVDFLLKLSEEQRTQFFAILSEVKQVDLKTLGSETAADVVALTDVEALAKKDFADAEKMSKENGKLVHENLAEIYAKRSESKAS